MYFSPARTAFRAPDVTQYGPPESPLGALLGAAFAEACRRDTTTARGTLHEATTSFVCQLTGRGAPPERVIVALKDALTRYGGSGSRPSFVDPDFEPEAAQYRRVFDWCLDALYGASAATARDATAVLPGLPPV